MIKQTFPTQYQLQALEVMWPAGTLLASDIGKWNTTLILQQVCPSTFRGDPQTLIISGKQMTQKKKLKFKNLFLFSLHQLKFFHNFANFCSTHSSFEKASISMALIIHILEQIESGRFLNCQAMSRVYSLFDM